LLRHFPPWQETAAARLQRRQHGDEHGRRWRWESRASPADQRRRNTNSRRTTSADSGYRAFRRAQVPASPNKLYRGAKHRQQPHGPVCSNIPITFLPPLFFEMPFCFLVKINARSTSSPKTARPQKHARVRRQPPPYPSCRPGLAGVQSVHAHRAQKKLGPQMLL
jgi:hypothetical protein